jgi:hypothetical protein
MCGADLVSLVITRTVLKKPNPNLILEDPNLLKIEKLKRSVSVNQCNLNYFFPVRPCLVGEMKSFQLL